MFAASQPRYGTPIFFLLIAAMALCQCAVLLGYRRAPRPRWLLALAFAFAVACRVPLALGPIAFTSDMIRYVWDGRVQRFGYNPYSVVPSDPALGHTHTADTARMPSRHDRTPYPPAAQLFFRLMVTISGSPRVMRLALLLCDLLTIALLWRWLRATGRDEWLAITYAWSPLVILEIAHGGHIDALGMFWLIAAAYCLTTRRTALAAAGFTLAVATKFLPIVLAPLFAGRVRIRDIVVGVLLLAALYAPFMSGGLPLGAVPAVLDHVRFNSPIFRPLAWIIPARGAAAFGLLVAVGGAIWARWRLEATDPAAWAWPMALALACAPVVYPWYLLYLTPFLFTRVTLPLFVWTFSVLPVYVVWERALQGARWIVPNDVLVLEFAVVLAAAAVVWTRRVHRPGRVPAPRI